MQSWSWETRERVTEMAKNGRTEGVESPRFHISID